MTTILKGYQFRLYPNNEQKKLINQTIGCSRFIYNHFLEERINEYKKTGISKTCYEQIKEIYKTERKIVDRDDKVKELIANNN